MSASVPTCDAEWSILLAACSQAPQQQKSTRLCTLLRQPVRWSRLFAMAERHGTQPLLYQALASVEAAVPAPEMQRLKQNYYQNLQKALLLSRELVRILEHLSAIGIDVIPYKGAVLAEMLYHDITLRQSGDIDLLIRAGDLPRVRDARR